MRKRSSLRVALLLAATVSMPAQEVPEREVLLCDRDNPASKCPGPECACLEDTLEVTFDGDSLSNLLVEETDVGSEIQATVILDTKTATIQGWSYGVEHDDLFLALELATIDETDAGAAFRDGFNATTTKGIQTCLGTGNSCAQTRPGGGWFSAVVLSLQTAVHLPIKRNSLARAVYTLDRQPPANGTFISFSERLQKVGSPPVAINVTADGGSRKPATVIDGWIRGPGEVVLEDCGNGQDDDGDGAVDCTDRDCSLVPPCRPLFEDCENGQDDDRDLLIDCDDADCALAPACLPPVEVCDNATDDDNDGRADCEDTDCSFFPACRRESCGNGFDDNDDGAVDCEDPDCDLAIICVPEVCDNGIDDNRNAMTDCYDPACDGFAGCERLPEVCDNGMDEDFDGRIDCEDNDCDDFEACLPRPEICDNRHDDDRDGRPDCRDSDCAGSEACEPKPEVCDNCFDDDRDGRMDCLDEDCVDHAFCQPRPEICDNGRDDDGDGLIDDDDTDCWIGPLQPLGACDDYALYFGQGSSGGDHEISGGEFEISMRNRSPVLAFRLGVLQTFVDGDTFYEFTAPYNVSSSQSRLEVLNDWGVLRSPRALNRAVIPGRRAAVSIGHGAALEGSRARGFLHTEILEQGFIVEYIVDLNLWPPRNVILPTATDASCNANEILRVTTALAQPDFRRGDIDASGDTHMTDAIRIIHVLFFEPEASSACPAALDVDDNGIVNLTDPIRILRHLYQGGEAPPEPFPMCGQDPTREEPRLGCVEFDCR